ncbi:MAG: hypothetical protein KDA68_24395, partial [Planctomycetaceae bacterium]|nr:hypothetical protein [Planctomycetaceae bacterium]
RLHGELDPGQRRGARAGRERGTSRLHVPGHHDIARPAASATRAAEARARRLDGGVAGGGAAGARTQIAGRHAALGPGRAGAAAGAALPVVPDAATGALTGATTATTADAAATATAEDVVLAAGVASLSDAGSRSHSGR